MHTKHEKYPLNQGSILCTGFANALKINLLRAEIPAPDTISDARFREALNVNTQFSEVSDISSMGHFVDLGQENTSVYAPSPETYFEKQGTSPADNNDKPRPSIRPQGGLPRPATHTHARAGNSNEPLGLPLVLTMAESDTQCACGSKTAPVR